MSNLDIASYNRQGKVFHTANVAAVSVLAVSTTMTGLILSNPYGSRKKLILVDGAWVWTTAGAAAHQAGWAVGYSSTAVTHTTPMIIYNADGSGVSASSIALADSSSTLPVVATARRWFGGSLGTAVSPYMVNDRIDGAIILVPGSYAHLTTVTTTMVGLGSVTWIEVPE